jgi:H/ACA ribonucleoprotein complex subunit 4
MQKKFLVKSEEASLVQFGKYPGARTVEELLNSGIVVIDKPAGPTSRMVDSFVKKILGLDKLSHGGTLDPRVSGVLAIALENATKLMPILLSSKKEYVALMNIHKELPEEKIRKVCDEFVGKILQTPPKKSAVARRERQREIYYLQILEISGRDVLMRVGCEAGTYIRKLCSDIGKRLGAGAHMQELRRTRAGIFTEEQAVSLQDMKDAYEFYKDGNGEPLRNMILPAERAADGIRNAVIKDSSVHNVASGAPVYANGLSRIEEGIEKGDIVGIFSLKGELVGIGFAEMDSMQMLKSSKGIAIKTDRVLMDRNLYPKV